MLWFKAFLLTQICEIPLAWLCIRLGQRNLSYTGVRIIGVTALATTITHPLLWFVLPDLLSGLDYTQYLILGELGVVLVESIVLYKGLKGLSFSTALVISAVMNAGSYLIGGILLYSDTLQ